MNFGLINTKFKTLFIENIDHQTLFFSLSLSLSSDSLTQTYPDVLAQSLYSSFCHAFPQSWKQFDDDDFKNMLSRVTAMWISGVRPFPRAYLKWNQEDLEPNKMREGQAFKTKGGHFLSVLISIF